MGVNSTGDVVKCTEDRRNSCKNTVLENKANHSKWGIHISPRKYSQTLYRNAMTLHQVFAQINPQPITTSIITYLLRFHFNVFPLGKLSQPPSKLN